MLNRRELRIDLFGVGLEMMWSWCCGWTKVFVNRVIGRVPCGVEGGILQLFTLVPEQSPISHSKRSHG